MEGSSAVGYDGELIPAAERLPDDLIGRRFPNAENLAFARELLALLSPGHRRLIELTAAGYEEAEIAVLLGISSGNNVRQIRHRIRRRVAAAMTVKQEGSSLS